MGIRPADDLRPGVAGKVDREAVERVLRFWTLLRHTKGRWAGRAFELLPWQRRVLEQLFGTVRPDGTRQYRVAYVSVPRKNGKSTFAAGVALYLLLADREPEAEVYSVAADRDQAAIVFSTARSMVEASPELRRRVRIYRRALEVPRTGSVYRVLSSDAPTKHGLNPHGVVFDELHAQPNRELWDVMLTSMGARQQPMLVALTTAGYDRESICYEVYDYAKRVLAGAIDDPSMYAVIYEADEGADWRDPAVWRAANPSLGHTVTEEYLRQEARRAEASPGYQNTFRRLYLNQWVQQYTRWLDLAVWDRCAAVLDESALVGRPCWAGLDLSSTTDLTAWALLWDLGEHLYLRVRHWVPEARVHDPSNRFRTQYEVWAREGWLRVTPGRTVDYDLVVRDIEQDAAKFAVRSVAIDRLFQGAHVATLLERAGLVVYGMGQGFMAMSGPTKEFERLLLSGKLLVEPNPVMRWQADNVVVKFDPAGNMRPTKQGSQGAIDGIVAAIMAVDRWMRSSQQHEVVLL